MGLDTRRIIPPRGSGLKGRTDLLDEVSRGLDARNVRDRFGGVSLVSGFWGLVAGWEESGEEPLSWLPLDPMVALHHE